MPSFPHLTDTDSVRREAEAQYGGLSDAAAFQAAVRAQRDPDVEAAALRQRNGEETAKVQNDLSLAQDKVDAAHGEGTYTVLDAAVRGHALSVIVEDQYGRPQHIVVPWTDQWRSVAPKGDAAAERAQAQAEAAKGRLGSEARAEVARMVAEATAGIVSRVNELLGGKIEEVQQIRDEEISKAVDERSDEERAALNAGLKISGGGSGSESKPKSKGSPSTTEGNDTSEASAGKTAGSETDDSDGDGDEAKWPRGHDALDALAAKNGVSFEELGARATVAEKIEALQKAGVTPPDEE